MNFIKKIFRDVFYDKKHGSYTFSIGRFMLVALFILAFYQWAFVGADILPNMFAIFSSLIVYVLGTKGINKWGQVSVVNKQEVQINNNSDSLLDELGD